MAWPGPKKAPREYQLAAAHFERQHRTPKRCRPNRKPTRESSPLQLRASSRLRLGKELPVPQATEAFN
jgi:hypothetical protein